MQTRTESFLRRALVSVALLAFALVFVVPAAAQDDELPDPRVEIFGGYSWFNPGEVDGFALPSIGKGFNAAVTWNFNRYFGLTADFSGHFHDDLDVGNYTFGPTVRYPIDRFVPFAHALFGFQNVSPVFIDSHTGFAMAVGGGIDIRMNRWLSWRAIQVDWMPSSHDFGLLDDSFNSTRLSSGLVLNLGSLQPPVPPSATCSASPTEVMEGEPVTVSATTTGFSEKRPATIAWTSTGGKLEQKGTSATIDTTGMAGGNYTATATATDPKKASRTATCSAAFTVKERPKNPPQVSCSANPATVQSGQSSTISCTCTSPDNVNLQPLAWQSSGGTVTGQGNSATLTTEGAPAGAITVTTTCTDERGLSSSATTNVNVEVPQKPEVSKIGECEFPGKPARVDNACKAVLDDVALRMQREADARVVIVGQKDAKERGNVDAQRAFNTKTYLVKDKQIDETRLETRTGQDGGKRVEMFLVPTGAEFDQGNTTVVNPPAKRGR